MNQKIIEKLEGYTKSKAFCFLFPKLAHTIKVAVARLQWLEDQQEKIAKELENDRSES